jgi:excisionase family DNA binding protein
MQKSALRIDEVCIETGLGRTSVYAAIKKGLLRACKYGRSTIILREDLERFLKALPTTGDVGEPEDPSLTLQPSQNGIAGVKDASAR